MNIVRRKRKGIERKRNEEKGKGKKRNKIFDKSQLT